VFHVDAARSGFVVVLGLLVAAAVLVVAVRTPPAQAKLLTKGKGKHRVLVREQFSPVQQRRFDLFASRCTRCHNMARSIEALETGMAPITGSKFEEVEIGRYVIKMMRKSKSGISKGDAEELIQFLRYARRLARTPGKDAPAPVAPVPQDASAPDAGPPAGEGARP
jgi:hypothetical protein